jgi:DNA repair ATPase RecN
LTPGQAKEIIEKLFQDLVDNQRDYPNYGELAAQINAIRAKIYDPANAGKVGDLIDEAKKLVGKEVDPEKPLTDAQKAALERYKQALEALEELKQKFGSLPNEIAKLEETIKKLLEDLKKCEEGLGKLTGKELIEAKEAYDLLKQKLLDAHANLDFLKEEYRNLENSQKNLFGDLDRYLQDLSRLKDDILNGSPTEAEDKLKELEALFKEFKQKTADYDHSLSEDKENFNRNQQDLTHELTDCLKDLEALKELVKLPIPPPPDKPPIPNFPAKPTGNETPEEAAKKITDYFEYLAAHWPELGFTDEEYKALINTLNKLRVSILTMTPTDRKAALEKAYSDIQPLTEEARAARKGFEEAKKIYDIIKNISDPAALQGLIDELRKLLEECRGKPGSEKYQDLLNTLTSVQNQLASLSNNAKSWATALLAMFSQIEQLKEAIRQEPSAQKRQELLSQLNSLTGQMQSYLRDNSISLDKLTENLTKIETDLKVLKLDIREMRRKTGLAPPFDDEKGQDMYFDFGIFQNDVKKFIDYSTIPPRFKMEEFKLYLDDLFKRLSEAGINKLFLSFSQLVNIEYLAGKSSAPPSQDATDRDTILQIFNIAKECGLPADEIFKQFVNRAHENNFQINLSIGGERATVENFSIGNNPKAAAEAMFEFMKRYNIDSIDIDIEGAPVEAVNRNPQGFQAYFMELHRLLKEEGAGRKVFLTPLADWTHAKHDPNIKYPNTSASILEALFFDRNGQSIFKDMFDGLNLMTYSATQYYLDADHDTWGIEQWIDLIGGPEYAYMISIGFEDNIPYHKPGGNANPDNGYLIKPGSTPGEAAAQVFLQLVAQLMKDGYLPLDAKGPEYGLGKSFGWPDNAKDETYQGVNSFMKDMMEYLKDFSPKEYLK